jgi:hypothetical protein
LCQTVGLQPCAFQKTRQNGRVRERIVQGRKSAAPSHAEQRGVPFIIPNKWCGIRSYRVRTILNERDGFDLRGIRVRPSGSSYRPFSSAQMKEARPANPSPIAIGTRKKKSIIGAVH